MMIMMVVVRGWWDVYASGLRLADSTDSNTIKALPSSATHCQLASFAYLITLIYRHMLYKIIFAQYIFQLYSSFVIAGLSISLIKLVQQQNAQFNLFSWC